MLWVEKQIGREHSTQDGRSAQICALLIQEKQRGIVQLTQTYYRLLINDCEVESTCKYSIAS